jgi:hypothetical protein
MLVSKLVGKGCVRQSNYIQSLSIENATGMPYLKIEKMDCSVEYINYTLVLHYTNLVRCCRACSLTWYKYT